MVTTHDDLMKPPGSKQEVTELLWNHWSKRTICWNMS